MVCGATDEETPNPFCSHGWSDSGGFRRGGSAGVNRGRPHPRHMESTFGGRMVMVSERATRLISQLLLQLFLYILSFVNVI